MEPKGEALAIGISLSREQKLALGPHPAIDLRTARSRREEEKTRLRDGNVPAAEKGREKLTDRANRENISEAIAVEWGAIKEAGTYRQCDEIGS